MVLRGIKVSASSTEVQTYASVVFETALKSWLEGLGEVAAAFSRNPALLQQLTDSTTDFERRQALLLSVLPESAPQPVRNFLLAMLANGDINLLDEVLEELNLRVAAAGGPRPVVAEVTSAVELSNEERQAIQNRLIEQFGPNLDFKFHVDPAILGGLVVRVGDKLLDTSVAGKLAALRQTLGMRTN